MEDIVTKLRQRASEREEALNEYWGGYNFEYKIPMLENKAADEIERLRADRDHWRSIAEQAVENADQAVKLLEKLTGISGD